MTVNIDLKNYLKHQEATCEKRVRECLDQNSYAAGMYYGELCMVREILMAIKDAEEALAKIEGKE